LRELQGHGRRVGRLFVDDVDGARHGGGHFALHAFVVAGFAAHDVPDGLFGVGTGDVHLDWAGLAEAMAAPHGLIEALVGEAQADEAHARTVLPVQAETGD